MSRSRGRDYLVVALTDLPQNAWCRGLRGALAQELNQSADRIALPNGSIALLKRMG